MKYKTKEILIRVGSPKKGYRDKMYKVPVPYVKDIGEALRELGCMAEVISIINDRLATVSCNTFRAAMRNGRMTATAKKLARIARPLEVSDEHRIKHVLLSKKKLVDAIKMNPEKLAEALKKLSLM